MTSLHLDYEPLKPCPFCGSAAEYVSGSYDCHWVVCNGCGAQTSEDGSMNEEQAIEKWNRRIEQQT